MPHRINISYDSILLLRFYPFVFSRLRKFLFSRAIFFYLGVVISDHVGLDITLFEIEHARGEE
ncbi:hypothetical protein KSB_77410 [Ktedonobacter robiniae]|uniref:Uncharacterized protein n=1 Tax=Ktedonobacter robiniae TaxID=2778365 RepID=A0ABQ3V2T2_9CHLR|nr:hypothetical protein KSB_77410 [Ktedonobacter robiniae]